jgi:branched-subunit amino acid transport protein
VSNTSIWIAIVLGGLVTYAIRVTFLAFADRVAAVPPRVRIALRMIPAAALAALAIPPLLRPDERWELASPELFAGLVALGVAWKTRSIPATLATGILVVVLLEQVL